MSICGASCFHEDAEQVDEVESVTQSTVYVLEVHGTKKEYSVLEDAIRAWDRATWRREPSSGGIRAQTRDSQGLMTRDGWILHVDGGITYLNPNLKEKNL